MRGNEGTERSINRTNNDETSLGFYINSPATAPVLRSFMGAFGKRLFKRSEFPIAAHRTAQHRKQAGGGVIYFGYFLLDKQKKVTHQSRESDN